MPLLKKKSFKGVFSDFENLSEKDELKEQLNETGQTKKIIKGIKLSEENTIVLEKITKNFSKINNEGSNQFKTDLVEQEKFDPSVITEEIKAEPIKQSNIENESQKSSEKIETSEPRKIEPQIIETKAEKIQPVLKETPIVPKIDETAINQAILQKKAQAEQEIAEYKKQAMLKIEEEKKTILDQAYKEGHEQGLKDASASLGDQAEEILKTVNSAVAEKNKILKMARGEVLKLAIKVAEQILKSEISLNQAVCVNIVAEAISKITDKDRVIIRINRLDADFVKMNRDRLMKQLGEVKNLVIQEDSRVEQGGCIIETDLGYIDATVATKLESLEHAVFKVYQEELEEEESAGKATDA